MAALTITLEPEELLGLNALVEMERVKSGGQTGTDAESTARALIDDSLAAKLNELGLAWAPSPESVKDRAEKAARAHRPPSSKNLRAVMRDARVRRYGSAVLATAALVALFGGYAGGWQWTGFRANNQLWDWLHLLLLPVVIGTVPIWLLHAERMSLARRRAYGVFALAFAGFVVVGYLVPLNWTGFSGNTLWDWFLLLVLPLTIVVTGVWPKTSRTLRTHHKALLALLGIGWVVSLIGGYVWAWSWTGYQGNTLWDWLQLLLLPLVFPTIVLPTLVSWVSGNAAAVVRDTEHGAGEARQHVAPRAHARPDAAASVRTARRT